MLRVYRSATRACESVKFKMKRAKHLSKHWKSIFQYIDLRPGRESHVVPLERDSWEPSGSQPPRRENSRFPDPFLVRISPRNQNTGKVFFQYIDLRPGRDSNPRIAVLQTAALPLRHLALRCFCLLFLYDFKEEFWNGAETGVF